MTSSDKVRDALLPYTLRHACSVSPFYRARYAMSALNANISITNLPSFPILSKGDLTEHYDEICCPSSFPTMLMYTSGTEGKQLLVPVSREEILASENLIQQAFDDRQINPLTLSILRVGHGGQMQSAFVPTIPAHINYGPEQVVSLLQRTYKFPGVESKPSILEGNLISLRTLTKELIKRDLDGSRFGIRLVLTTGWYLTSFMRELIEKYWSAPVLDRYGVTEVNGDAKQCPVCKDFHFDPFVIAEVIDPITKMPVKEGIGSIVLTGLWPFNQVAPKIRYEIGDFVYRTHKPKCGLDEPGYRYLGRHAQTITVTNEGSIRYILFPTDVAEVLDAIPNVVRREQTGFLNFFSELIPQGNRPPILIVQVERIGDRTSFGLKDAIQEQLLLKSAHLRSAIADKICSIEVKLVEPKSLTRIHKL